MFAQNNAALLESGNKNEPTKIARFDRIVDKTTRAKYDQLLAGSHRPTGDTATSTLHVAVPRDFMPTDVSNEIGGDDLQKSVHDAGVAGEPAVDTANRYSRNNSNLEVFNDDLAKKATVDGLIMYALKSREAQLKEWERVKTSYPEEAEPQNSGGAEQVLRSCRPLQVGHDGIQYY